jgi:glycosyltransferase involved in cell wall biosynthesis
LNRKPRILWVCESPSLNTGYSVYTRNLLTYLSSTGNFDVAQLSCHTQDDSDYVNSYPWKIYPAEPPKNSPARSEFDSSHVNAFGAWRFERTCISFLPDFVVDIRDWWAVEFQRRSPFFGLFSWVQMPTIDSSPQHKQWTETYATCDQLFTYTDWAKEVLEAQMGPVNSISVPPVASPDYQPLNKRKLKEEYGLSGCIVFGFVGRNQKRKLFPALFKAFSEFCDNNPDTPARILCHTSYPDAGWDIQALLKSRHANKILFTYRCASCDVFSVKPFQAIVSQCKNCKNVSSALCNVEKGISDSDLAKVYNLMDVYVHTCTNEGFGMPIVEAAACGVAVAATNYSAPEDILNKLEGDKIIPSAIAKETETGTDKAYLSSADIMPIFKKYMSLPHELIWRKGKRTRQLFEQHYGSWEQTAKKWEEYFLSKPLKPFTETWMSPPRLFQSETEIPNFTNAYDASCWLICRVLGQPEQMYTYFHAKLTRDISLGIRRNQIGSEYFHEYPMVQMSHETFNIQVAYDALKSRRDFINQCEMERYNAYRRT